MDFSTLHEIKFSKALGEKHDVFHVVWGLSWISFDIVLLCIVLDFCCDIPVQVEPGKPGAEV